MSAKKLIVCVCRGNILRSAVAEELIKHHLFVLELSEGYDVVSRSIQGTSLDSKPVRYPNLTYYSEVYQRVKPVLDELNVDLTHHVSTAIDDHVACSASHIFAMDRSTKISLETLFPKYTDKIILFSDIVHREDDVSDVPYNTKPTYSVRTIRDIKSILDKGLDNLLSIITANKSAKN